MLSGMFCLRVFFVYVCLCVCFNTYLCVSFVIGCGVMYGLLCLVCVLGVFVCGLKCVCFVCDLIWGDVWFVCAVVIALCV